jgi:lipoprotein signal peptidase
MRVLVRLAAMFYYLSSHNYPCFNIHDVAVVNAIKMYVLQHFVVKS